MRFAKTSVLSAMLAWTLIPATAFAYIDPNTGGMLFQILAPLIAAITSAWLFARDRIKAACYRVYRYFVPRKDAPAGASATESPTRPAE